MMDDLISRKEAIDALTENKEMINAVLDSLTLDYNTRINQEQRRVQIHEDIKTIKELPSAQPERQVGAWIEYIPEHGKCPFCGNQVDLLNGKANNFCGECGAKMEENMIRNDG